MGSSFLALKTAYIMETNIGFYDLLHGGFIMKIIANIRNTFLNEIIGMYIKKHLGAEVELNLRDARVKDSGHGSYIVSIDGDIEIKKDDMERKLIHIVKGI